MLSIRCTENGPRPSFGLPSDYTQQNAKWVKITNFYHIATIVFYHHITSISNKFHKANLYPVCYLNLPLLGVSGFLSDNCTHWKVLPFITWEPCKYLFLNSYRRNFTFAIYLPHVVVTGYKYYLAMSYVCSPLVSESNKHNFPNPYRRKVLSSYWRKVTSLLTHTYYSMIHFLECLNIFQILMDIVNKTIQNKLIIHIYNIHIHV